MLRQLYSDENYRCEELAVRSPDRCFVELDVLSRIQRQLRGGRILDVGCGAGHFLACAKQSGFEGCGIEVASHSAQFARTSYDLKVAPSLETLGEPAESFDVVTLIGVIEHIQQPLQFLRAVQQFVKPNGFVFILTDNHRSWMHWLMKERFPWIIPPEHLQLFSPRAISVLFEQSGLQLIEISSKETIFRDAAVRGFAKLTGNNPLVKWIGKFAAGPLLFLTYPIRRLLWEAKLGAQIYCMAQKPPAQPS